MLVRSAGEINAGLPVSEIMDHETDRLLWIQNHYYSSYGSNDYPREGQVFTSFSDQMSFDALEQLDGLNGFVSGDVDDDDAGMAQASASNKISLRDGYWVPGGGYYSANPVILGIRAGEGDQATFERDHRRDASSIEITPPSEERVVEAGLGAMMRDGQDFLVSLRQEGQANEGEINLRRYERTGLEHGRHIFRLVAQRPAPTEEEAKAFLQLYRNAWWGSVSEPA